MSYGAIAIFLFGAYLAVCLMYPILRKNHSCLHCGKGTGDYCESCYQDLIAKNMKWQTDYLRLEREMTIKENQINKMIERKNEYIRDLEHIRDCYYKEQELKEKEIK